MRRIFGLSVLLSVPIAWGQSPLPESPALSALMAEVRELRLALERSTLLGARTQIAIQRIQMQEARVSGAAKTLEDVRKEVTRAQQERADIASHLKDLENQLGQVSSPDQRRALETQIQSFKDRAADGSGEAQARAREAEAFSEFRAEQSRLDQLNAAISEMEAALDSAIRQITGTH